MEIKRMMNCRKCCLPTVAETHSQKNVCCLSEMMMEIISVQNLCNNTAKLSDVCFQWFSVCTHTAAWSVGVHILPLTHTLQRCCSSMLITWSTCLWLTAENSTGCLWQPWCSAEGVNDLWKQTHRRPEWLTQTFPLHTCPLVLAYTFLMFGRNEYHNSALTQRFLQHFNLNSAF